jgi:hypothetical protein
MNKEQAINKLQKQLNNIHSLYSKPRFSDDFHKWKRDTEVAIENIFGADKRHLNDFTEIDYIFPVLAAYATSEERNQEFKQGLSRAKSTIESFIQEIEEYWNDENSIESFSNTVEKIKLICDKFHQIARQMRVRHNKKPTLEVNDEYDVQDLFHALLILYFDDIRKEENHPSYAGANSRSDFLLKPEQTIIEIKKTRGGLKDKQLGEELTLDIQKYQTHPNCKTLICFIYDPEGKISNPRGLEQDLERATEKIEVKVFIRQS